MSNAGWGPQNQPGPNQPGQPPQGPPGGYPPQGPPPGYPPQPGQGGGYPPQGQPGYPPGYPPQPQGYATQQPSPGGYRPQGAYNPQAAYGQRPGQPGAGYPPQGPAAKKSPLMIILIVAAAVVLLAAVGGIIMALNRGGGDQPETTITPTQPTSAPTQPTDPTPSPSSQPTRPTSPEPSDEPTPPSGDSVDLGNGISLTPASGWSVTKTGKGVAQLSNGSEIFLGQAISTQPSTNPGQLCTAWHKQVTEGTSGGKFQDPKDVNLGTSKVKGATCVAQTTVSSGQGTATIFLFSLVSVRQSDGVSVLGTAYFTDSANTEQLNQDFTTMVNSMLDGQTS